VVSGVPRRPSGAFLSQPAAGPTLVPGVSERYDCSLPARV